ncbi:carboxymuconolactone decarboxylase family protein [Arthrobacter sp. GMC3]|uniref:carboxymuconolactone decarboxylase family protein n=1 Tax=Arthrobacter sp. GMC3 TaxID=2058894 RepID=UPI0015E2FE68|nr:carboxymuconolactone decarboxylase family protein [Arthrobacter sp. GMC3]
MNERFTPLTREQLDIKQAALYDSLATSAAGKQDFSLVDSKGALVGPFGLMLLDPELGVAIQNLGAVFNSGSPLTHRTREIAILRVATLEASDFEWYAHEPIARAIGLNDVEIAAIRAGTFAVQNAEEQAAFDLMGTFLGDGILSDAEFARLQDAVGARALYALIGLAGYYRMIAQSMRAFGVGVPDPVAG